MKHFFLLLFMICSVQVSFGQDPEFDSRQEAYISDGLAASGGSKLVLQAYEGLPLDADELDNKLNQVATQPDPDFKIVELIRILFFSDGAYDDQILPVLDATPFWLNDGDTIRNYWTENHMSMWMSSEWLLHERYDRPVEATLYARLLHYLELKIEYGYYEFNSSVYAPYALSGLLNLVDFSEDLMLKELATQAAQRLLQDMLKMTTDIGVYFPTAGRSYHEKYRNAYGQNHNSLIYLLSGLGDVPAQASHSGAFLATSTLPVDEVLDSWVPTLDTIIQIAHPFEMSAEVHSEMTTSNRIIFQWSAGIYTHPDVAEESLQLIVDSSLWQHIDFEFLQPLSSVPPENAEELATTFAVISKSSVNTGHETYLFRNNSISLSSSLDFWKGKVGYQQFPCVAAVGTTAIYTASGEVTEDWADRDRTIENTHLPYVEQKHNMALIMYRPEPIPPLLDILAGEMFENKDVSLFWESDEFDEIVEDDLWLLGRQSENYVAVRRACDGEKNGWSACETNGGQAWVIMVGDASMYGSFTNFQDLIAESEFSEEWYYDPVSSQSVYYADISIDTLSIAYAWGVDSLATDIEEVLTSEPGLGLSPNPFSDNLQLDLSAFLNSDLRIRILDINGREMYVENNSALNEVMRSIDTSDWIPGLYFIMLENGDGYTIEKAVKM